MKVIATKQGYLGKLREPGEVFDAPEGLQASWFEPAEPGEVFDAPARGKKGKPQQETEPLV
jgi:hypothetical protein